MDPTVPLVIPRSRGRIRDHRGIIANPNCAAIAALLPRPITARTVSSA
jgi:aspartate-semialdehyde dehydrogenase